MPSCIVKNVEVVLKSVLFIKKKNPTGSSLSAYIWILMSAALTELGWSENKYSSPTELAINLGGTVA